jgi:hypothetical protein
MYFESIDVGEQSLVGLAFVIRLVLLVLLVIRVLLVLLLVLVASISINC